MVGEDNKIFDFRSPGVDAPMSEGDRLGATKEPGTVDKPAPIGNAELPNVKAEASHPGNLATKPSAPKGWTDGSFRGYDDIINYTKDRLDALGDAPTKEDIEKMRRKRKNEGIVGGISDAVRAIANMIAVHNYAPNSYDQTKSMSERMRERWEKEDEEAKNLEAERMYYMTQNAAWREKQHAYEKAEQQEADAKERRKVEDEWTRKVRAQQEALWPTEAELKEAKAKKAQWDALRAEVQAGMEPDLIEAKIKKLGNFKLGGSGKYYCTWNGKVYRTKADYELAVENLRVDMGISDGEFVETENAKGESSWRGVRKPTPKKAVEAERAKKNKKSPTAGGSGKKSPTK